MERAGMVLLAVACGGAGCFDFDARSALFGAGEAVPADGALAADATAPVDLAATDLDAARIEAGPPDLDLDLAAPDAAVPMEDLAADLASVDAAPGDQAITDLVMPPDLLVLDLAVPASCKDGMKNGGETDIDCGGRDCLACAVGRGCGGHDDCQSRACVAGACAAVEVVLRGAFAGGALRASGHGMLLSGRLSWPGAARFRGASSTLEGSLR